MDMGMSMSAGRGSDRLALGVVALATLVLTSLHYGAMPDHYVYVLTAYFHPETAAADIHLSGSFWPASSIIYTLNKWLVLQHREVLVLAMAMAVGVGGAVIVHVLLRRHFGLSAWAATLATLLLLMVDRKILPNAWPLLMPTHPGSPSMFTNVLGAGILLLLAEKRMAAAATVLLVLHMLATKENVLLLPSAVLYALACRDLGWRKALWFVLPLGYLAFMALTQTKVHAPFDVMLELTRLNIENEGGDGSFLRHGFMPNAMFLASLAATVWLVRPYASHIRRLVWAFAATAALLWLVSTLYLAFFWQILPLPQMLYIGPVRSMRYAIFLFYLVASARTLTCGALRHHQRAGLLVALHGVSPHSPFSTGLAAAALAMAFLPVLKAGAVAQLEGWHRRLPLLPEAIAVALWVAVQVGFSGYYYVRWNPVALAETGRFSSGVKVSADVWQAYATLREQPPYELLALYQDREGRLHMSLELTAHARKAAFDAHSFAGFVIRPTLEGLAEAHQRFTVANSVLAALNAVRPVDPADLAFIAQRRVRVMVPYAVAAAFGPAQITRIGPMALATLADGDPPRAPNPG